MAKAFLAFLLSWAVRLKNQKIFIKKEINKDSRKYRRKVLERKNRKRYSFGFYIKNYFSLFSKVVFSREFAPFAIVMCFFGGFTFLVFSVIPLSASAVGSGASGSTAFSSQNFTVGSGRYLSNFEKKENPTITKLGSATRFNLENGVAIRDDSVYSNDLDAMVQWPFPVGVPITSYYGEREAPIHGASTYHGGLDMTPGLGTPIGAIAKGRVNYINYGYDHLGVYVEVEHIIAGVRVTSVYGHLGRNTVAVTQGQEVNVGDELARVGNSGVSSGPHLHFEVRINGDAVDPIYFYKKIRGRALNVSLPAGILPPAIASGGKKLSHRDSRTAVDQLVAKISLE